MHRLGIMIRVRSGAGYNGAPIGNRALLGLELDAERNRAHTGGREGVITRDGSRLAAYVIPTDEELLIARDTVRCLHGVAQRY